MNQEQMITEKKKNVIWTNKPRELWEEPKKKGIPQI